MKKKKILPKRVVSHLYNFFYLKSYLFVNPYVAIYFYVANSKENWFLIVTLLSDYSVASQSQEFENTTSTQEGDKKKGMILPFQPLTMTFHNINYYVDMPQVCVLSSSDSFSSS